MTIDTLRLTAEQAHRLLQNGEVSGDELFAAYRAAIDERNGELNAYSRSSTIEAAIACRSRSRT